jgi:hypothetical protein
MDRKEMERKLHECFPWLDCLDEANSVLGLVFCKSGWYNLICEMLSEIEQIYNSKALQLKSIDFYEIKEKYGTMQTDVCSCIPEVFEIVERYEAKSEEVCEVCGAEGSLQDIDEWLMVRCEKCFHERKRRFYKQGNKMN